MSERTYQVTPYTLAGQWQRCTAAVDLTTNVQSLTLTVGAIGKHALLVDDVELKTE
ncbi:MAG: hypothetical protein ACR2IE_09600 [Candidatus Sumerlaeaceae bacterium]